MKKIFLLGCFAALAISHQSCKQDTSATNNEAGETSEGMEAEGAAKYEWQLTHNPATGKVPAHMRMKELAFAATLPSAGAAQGSGLYKTTAATWQARGPWNVGGRTRAFAVDVTNESILIAGTPSGGMWRSTDGGANWVTTTPVNEYQGATCLAQDTRTGKTNVWYFGTGEIYGASASGGGAAYSGNGIYKSTDGGVTWNVLSSTTSPTSSFTVWSDYVWNIVTDPSNTTNDVVYAAAYGGIYKSTDGGANWTLAKGTAVSTPGSVFTDVAITSTGVVYATLSSPNGAQKGIYRSTDGVTFTDITPAGFATTYNRIKIGISPSDESQVYFLGNTPGFGKEHISYSGGSEWNSLWKYKYLSGDGSGTGGIWQDFSINIPNTGGAFDKYQSQSSYDIVVKIKPNDTNTVFIGGTNLFRSTSGFSDSTNTTKIGGYAQGAALPIVNHYPEQHPDQHELVFSSSDPDKMIAAHDGGICITNDNTATPVVWTSLNNGYISSMFYTCAIDHATTDDIITAGAQDNGSWYTNSSTLTSPWVTPRGGDGSYCAIADNKSAYYFSIQLGKTMRAELDASGNVTKFARIDPIGPTSFGFINPFVLDPNNNNIMYMAGGSAMWRNDDLSGIPYASNWDSISTNWTRLPSTSSQITAVAVSKNPANRLYYGTASKQVFRVDAANTGTPNAENMTAISFPQGGYVSCIAVDPSNADNVMVVFSNYGVKSIYYSTDGGDKWTVVSGDLEENADGSGNGPSVRWAKIINTTGGNVYLVGTSIGLYATTKLNGDGTFWTQQSPNEIGHSVVTMIDYRATDGLVVVATHSHGLFSTHITNVNDVVGVREVNAGKRDFKFSNHPNPFSKQTSITFTLKNKSFVSLKVYNQLGREVSTIAAKMMEAGDKQIAFDAGNLPAGTYYCALQAGSYTETRKLIIVK